MRLREYNVKRARIEIVPMIDTIFFLLVYFLIASLTMTRMNAQKVALPQSYTASGHASSQVIVTVDHAGRYYLDRDSVAEEQVKPALESRLAADPNLTVVINCDKDQPVAGFNRVYDLVKQANAANVMVATTPVTGWKQTP
jgi:biopolymer transport protein ExbD